MNDKYSFYYTQKLMVFRNNDQELLLARRAGEIDMNQIYTCIGGKLEADDNSLENGLKREKDEEVGSSFKIKVCPTISFNVHFVRNDGQQVIVPHVYARYVSGDIDLNEEYDDFQWVSIEQLADFEPKVANIPEISAKLRSLSQSFDESDFITI